MTIQFHFVNISDVLKQDLKDYALTRFPKLEQFLTTFQEDEILLHISIEYQEKHTFFEVRCALHVGGKTFQHTDDTHDPKKAIDRSEGNLLRQVKNYVEELKERRKSS